MQENMSTAEAFSNVDVKGLSEKLRAVRDSMQAVGEAARKATKSLPRSTTLPALAALHATGKQIYAGTADPVRVAERRAANKRARKARRVFRVRNARKGVR